MSKLEDDLLSLIESSGLFDKQWYLSKYPDVAKSNIDPVEHYILYGAALGRNPSPSFQHYCLYAVSIDVKKSGINPLIHFIKHGQKEGRTATPQQTSIPYPNQTYKNFETYLKFSFTLSPNPAGPF